MHADTPKQFIEIQGKPILMHTLEAFRCYDASMQLIVVLPAAQVECWNKLCDKHNFRLPHRIVTGGQTRFESVRNGLQAVQTPALVAVHDGVRPLVSKETIARCFDAAAEKQAVIPVIDLVDSLRQVTENGNQAVDRSAYKLVQTPQVFDAALLKKAYEQHFSDLFTDDASVVEALGAKIHLVEGNRENIKITTGFDLELAEVLLKSRL
jgi:2-C-methyl-D-erythritol 4-phosphate cytidylyltransferase